MPLGIRKNVDETWRECAIRYGKKYGLQDEVETYFDAAVKRGTPEDEAAFYACGEWDVLDFIPDDEEDDESDRD